MFGSICISNVKSPALPPSWWWIVSVYSCTSLITIEPRTCKKSAALTWPDWARRSLTQNKSDVFSKFNLEVFLRANFICIYNWDGWSTPQKFGASPLVFPQFKKKLRELKVIKIYACPEDDLIFFKQYASIDYSKTGLSTLISKD